jgi:hypothetical protein
MYGLFRRERAPDDNLQPGAFLRLDISGYKSNLRASHEGSYAITVKRQALISFPNVRQ